MLEPHAYLARVEVALGSDFEVAHGEIGGRPVLIGRTSAFRWRWFASRLETTVALGEFGAAEARTEALDAFLEAAIRWGLAHRTARRPVGLQTGTATIAVAVLAAPSEEARSWASRAHKHRFGSVPYPVAVDCSSRTVSQPARMILGSAFASYLRALTDDLVAAPLRAA